MNMVLPDGWSPEDDPVTALLLRGEAGTVVEAENRFLDTSLPAVAELVNSPLSDAEFRRHPLIVMLLSHGSRPWEDSLR